MNRKTLIAILSLVGVAFIVAGLWPFDFHPENKVMLLPDENGLRLFGVGNARSREPFSLSDTLFLNRSFSFEILVRPHQEPSHAVPDLLTILDGNGIEHIVIGQWKSTLIIRVPAQSSSAAKRYREIGIADALIQGRARLITVTASERETTIYLDGNRAQIFPRFSLLPGPDHLTGYLVIGNVHSGRNFWNGDILGLRIYDRQLRDGEIQLHARDWRKNGIPRSERQHDRIAEYDFDLRDSPLIVNRTGALPDMVISDVFRPLRRKILELPRHREWKPMPAAVDILINIAGFIPFGFFFSALLRRTDSFSARLIWPITAAAGTAISLAIEVTQAYLPMRHSSATDLGCNIFGTIIGTIILVKTRYFHSA